MINLSKLLGFRLLHQATAKLASAGKDIYNLGSVGAFVALLGELKSFSIVAWLSSLHQHLLHFFGLGLAVPVDGEDTTVAVLEDRVEI